MDWPVAQARVRTWKELTDAGFIEIVASKPASRRASTAASPEIERDIETPKSPFQKTGDNSEAQRRKAKAWIDNVLPHLEGVDLAYTIADEFHIDDQDIVADLIAYAQERMLEAPADVTLMRGAMSDAHRRSIIGPTIDERLPSGHCQSSSTGAPLATNDRQADADILTRQLRRRREIADRQG